MASQLLKRCLNRRTQKYVEIHIVTHTDAYRRLLLPGWESVKEEHIKRVEEEVQKLPENAKTVKIRNLYHPSAEDPGTHITTKHVTKDPAEQGHLRRRQATSSTSGWVWDDNYQKNRYWDGEKWVWE